MDWFIPPQNFSPTRQKKSYSACEKYGQQKKHKHLFFSLAFVI